MISIPNSNFFKDGVREIHYVLAFKEENLDLLQTFLNNLKEKGVDTEVAVGKKVYLCFILVHLPDNQRTRYSKEYSIGMERMRTNYANLDILRRFHFQRLPTFSDYEKRDMTNANCILILNKILRTTKFGPGISQYGLNKLKKTNIIIDHYPLHEGPIRYHFREINEENLENFNDRELLYRYWASFRVWNCEIPLDLIKKYYGYEIAFYFHFLEYFNLMLFPMALLGVIVIILNVCLYFFTEVFSVEEICDNTNMYMCPNCNSKMFCFYVPLSNYCTAFKWTYIFDNYWTVCFAILISFWATFFLNVWIRRTNELKLRWDVYREDFEINIRREYEEKVQHYKYNNFTGKMEPQISPFQKIVRYTTVSIAYIFLLSVSIMMVYAVFGLEMVIKIYFRVSPVAVSKGNISAIITIAGSALLMLMVKINREIVPPISKWLTELEMPRTQKQYDKSLMYKRYILSFCNNYTVLFYTAFVKGNLYGTPHRDVKDYIQRDSCQPLACVIDLASQVFFILVFRRLLWNILRALFVVVKKVLKKLCPPNAPNYAPQYEEEFRLLPTSRAMLHVNFNEMIIQYGLVTFFGAAIPLAPLLVLIDNMLEMRLSASRLVSRRRRPVPKIIPGIGPWQGILTGLMYFSTAVNAFVIAFSTQFVSREVFRVKHNFQLKGFINYTLSEFNTKDYSVYGTIKEQQDICYYMGMREPPSSPFKYRLTTDFWTNLTWKLVFLITFEHIIMAMNAFLSFMIRDVPPIVRDHIAFNRERVQEARVRLSRAQEETMHMRFRGRSMLTINPNN